MKKTNLKPVTVSDNMSGTHSYVFTFTGITPVMFDRYAGDNTTKLPWYDKVYVIPGTRILCLPTSNLTSFLTAQNTASAPKRLRDVRKYKKICSACLSYTMFQSVEGNMQYIPFLRNGEPIILGEINDKDVDEVSGMYVDRRVARLEKGIPNPKERPVLPTPWELTFRLTLLKNNEINIQEIQSLFTEGGIAIGLGTYRGVFGKFSVTMEED